MVNTASSHACGEAEVNACGAAEVNARASSAYATSRPIVRRHYFHIQTRMHAKKSNPRNEKIRSSANQRFSSFFALIVLVIIIVDGNNTSSKEQAHGSAWCRSSTRQARRPSFILRFAPKRPFTQASSSPQPRTQISIMPNLLKDLVSMVSPQFKRPMQSPSTTNRLSPAKQNVASGPFADFAARRENANAGVTVEQQQDQAKMDSFVFFNMMR